LSRKRFFLSQKNNKFLGKYFSDDDKLMATFRFLEIVKIYTRVFPVNVDNGIKNNQHTCASEWILI
jgi:hypothetical protein